MRNLAIFVALGWFWLTFYSVGPVTSWAQAGWGGLALILGCSAFALWGAMIASRRRPR